MNTLKNAIPLQMRWIAIFLGVSFLFWLSIEDTSTNPAIVFSILLSAWIAGAYLIIPNRPFPAFLANHILAGILVGVAITPLTLFLMALKSGLHNHPIPDFTPQEIISVIERTPIWLIGGFLVGLGSGLWRTDRQPQ